MWRTIRRLFATGYIRTSEWLLARFGRRKPYGVLTFELSGDLAEEGGEQRFFGLLRRRASDYLDTVTLLRWARDDARLAGVVIRCDDLQASWARLQGLRRSLERLRAAGKTVWVHLERAGVREYYLASAADHVSLTPAATLDVTGLSSEAIFLFDALRKLGVEADVVQMGRQVGGRRSSRAPTSPPHREMLESLVETCSASWWTHWPVAVTWRWPRCATSGATLVPASAREARLVDGSPTPTRSSNASSPRAAPRATIARDAYTIRRGRRCGSTRCGGARRSRCCTSAAR